MPPKFGEVKRKLLCKEGTPELTFLHDNFNQRAFRCQNTSLSPTLDAVDIVSIYLVPDLPASVDNSTSCRSTPLMQNVSLPMRS